MIDHPTKWSRFKMLRVREIWIMWVPNGSHPRVLRITHHQDRIISLLHMAKGKVELPGELTNKSMWKDQAHPHMVLMPINNQSNITLPEMGQESTSINTELEKMASTEEIATRPLEKPLRNHATFQITPEDFRSQLARRASHLLEEFRSIWAVEFKLL